MLKGVGYEEKTVLHSLKVFVAEFVFKNPVSIPGL